MAKRKFYDSSERAIESKEGAMISEDHSAMANLPQQVMMKYYPKSPYGLSSDLDDTIRGVDKQMSADDNGMKKHISKSKY
jgi:predicted solute-binding protein